MYLGPGYRNFSRRMRLQADNRISTSRKIPKDQNGNLRQSMETLHRRIPPGYDGRGLGGSRKHRMSRYVFRLCRRTVPLPENRRKIRRTLPCCTQRSRNLSILRLADMGNRQPHRNVPIQRRPRCLQKNNQADVRRTRPVTIRRLSIFWKLIHQILSICLKPLKISLDHLFQMFQCIFSVFKYSLLNRIK